MQPLKHNFAAKAGTTFRRVLIFKDEDDHLIDMTGWTARMQLRTAIDATGAPAVDVNTTNGGITIRPTHGEITILISDTVMSAANTTGSPITYYYDLEVVNSLGEVDSPLYGKIKIAPEVTK